MKVFFDGKQVAEVEGVDIYVDTMLLDRDAIDSSCPTVFFEGLGPAEFSRGNIDIGVKTLLITNSTWKTKRKS